MGSRRVSVRTGVESCVPGGPAVQRVPGKAVPTRPGTTPHWLSYAQATHYRYGVLPLIHAIHYHCSYFHGVHTLPLPCVRQGRRSTREVALPTL